MNADILKDFPRLREKLKGIRCRSGSSDGLVFLLGGLVFDILAVLLRRSGAFAAAVMFTLSLLCFLAACYFLVRHVIESVKAKDTWLKAGEEQLKELDRLADRMPVKYGCLLYDDCLTARTPAGNVFLNYEDILWVYGRKQIRRFADIVLSRENSVYCVDIEGNEFRLMFCSDEGEDPDKMAELLLDKMHRAGFYPLQGYDASFRKEIRNDLDLLKRRYEQSMSEQFEKKPGKWICPHCTAENENTERCAYCGCLREIKIPDTPVEEAPAPETPAPEAPAKEKDYSWVAPNPGTRTTSRSNPMLTVFLLVACVAVMAVSLLIARMMSSNSASASYPTETPSEAYEEMQEGDNRLMDGVPGDTISTAFFDFTVNDAHMADSYGDQKPADGNVFCVVNVTVHNTMRQSLPMFDTDFILFWGPGDEDGSFPITYEAADRRTGDMLENSYYIGINETASGDLVYEIPKTHDPEGILYFEEYFENGEYGDYYTVTFPLD